jgi:MFS family permease
MNWGALGVLYASYYMARYNFRFATPGMVEEFGFDVAGITQIFVVWSLAYGTGQLVNGLLADRILFRRYPRHLRSHRHPQWLVPVLRGPGDDQNQCRLVCPP